MTVSGALRPQVGFHLCNPEKNDLVLEMGDDFCLPRLKTKTSKKTFISRGHPNNEPLSFQCKSELFELQLAKVFLFGKVSTEEPPVLPGSFCLQGWTL